MKKREVMITYFILLMISPFIRTGMSLDHHFASQSQNTAQLDAKKKKNHTCLWGCTNTKLRFNSPYIIIYYCWLFAALHCSTSSQHVYFEVFLFIQCFYLHFTVTSLKIKRKKKTKPWTWLFCSAMFHLNNN